MRSSFEIDQASEVTASTAYVSSILAAAGPSRVGARPRAETVPRLQSSRAGIWAREQFRTKLWFRSMARARGYDSRFHMTCFAPSRSYRDQCARSRNRQRPLASPGRTSLKQQESSPGSFRLTLCSRLFCFSIASKDIVLKNIVPRTAPALRPGRQQVEGHAEDNVDGNDQGAEEPSRAAAVGNEGRGYRRDQRHRHRAWPELQVHRRRTDRVT